MDVDELEIAEAIQRIKLDYQRIKDQMVEALGREPTSAEMMEVAPRHIEVLSQLHNIRIKEARSRSQIPQSLLVQTFLTKILRG